MVKKKQVDTNKTTKLEELEEANEAYSQMNEALKLAADKIQDMLLDISKSGVMRMWKLGDYVRKIRVNEEKYGDNAIRLINKVIPSCDHGMVKKAIRLNSWVDEPQLEKMVNLRMKQSGKPLSWQHYEKLLTIKETTDRDELLKETINNDWTPEELQVAALKKRGQDTKHAGGRKVVIPPTFSGRCVHFMKRFDAVVRDSEKIYMHKEHGFLASASSIPADSITPEKIETINKMLEKANEVSDICRKAAFQLEDTKDVLQQRMNAQAKKQAAGDVDDITVDGPNEKKAKRASVGVR